MQKVSALLAILLVPLLVGAQNTTWITAMINEVIELLWLAVPALMGLALLFVLWNLVIFIAKSDDERGRAEGKTRMLWGLLALFVIVAIWGIVAIVAQVTGIDRDATITSPSITR